MENLTFTLNEVFNAILERRQTQGALTKEEYLDLIEDELEERRNRGELEDDFDSEQAREVLEARWEEVVESDADHSDDAEDNEGSV